MFPNRAMAVSPCRMFFNWASSQLQRGYSTVTQSPLACEAWLDQTWEAPPISASARHLRRLGHTLVKNLNVGVGLEEAYNDARD